MTESEEHANQIRERAKQLGFDPVGFCAAHDFPATERSMVERITSGMMDGLHWFTIDRAKMACRPRTRFPWARSIISLAVPYDILEPLPSQREGDTGRGIQGHVSRYALGTDYHTTIAERLRRLEQFVGQAGSDILTRSYVDTGPVPERAIAARAGIGWFGKNGNILTTRHGSWVFLAEVFTSLELTPDKPLKKSCGGCMRCLAACPTGALVAPYTVDSTRCIAYLTIELRGSVPRNLRPLLGERVFGCDRCQEVCPVNLRAEATFTHPSQSTYCSGDTTDLLALLALDEETFRQLYRASPIHRAGWNGLRRNAAVALGNRGDRSAVPALVEALRDADPLVKEHIVWALGRVGGSEAKQALQRARRAENEPTVLEEFNLALG